MAYIANDKSFDIDDLLKRKEFYWLKRWHATKQKADEPPIIPRFLLEYSIKQSLNLNLSSYQHFVKNFINPNTPYKRLLLKWGTGTGKTIGLLSIAMSFIHTYRIENEAGNHDIGSIFILGFSERVFKNDLLKFPQFGFISRDERYKLNNLRRIAVQGSKQDVYAYKEMLLRIKRRLTNRKGYGFFRFYGYKALVNRIFVALPGIDINHLSEEEIVKHISDGKIKYNEELIKQFKNSLMICDEIHNVYNSLEKNNWGIAIQSILDREPSCRAVFASATPLNNSPTEIIDILNLLSNKEERVSKSLLFRGQELKPGAKDIISKLAQGKISYLQDLNPKYYPSVEFVGETISSIAYLKFIRCEMSKFQFKTYVASGVLDSDAIAQDNQYVMDFAIENPENPDIGLINTSQIKNLITHASSKWKEKYGFDYRNNYLVGDALRYDSLKKYSAKYGAMLDALRDVIANQKGKVFIFHNVVHISGALFIEQVLLKNGFLDEFAASGPDTICVICGKKKAEHPEFKIKESDKHNKSTKVNNKNAKNDKKHNTKKKKRGGTSFIIDGEPIAKVSEVNDAYYVAADTLDSRLVQGQSQYLNKFTTDLLENYTGKPVLVEVPAYAPRLGEWLLQVEFKVVRQDANTKHFIMARNGNENGNENGNSTDSNGNENGANKIEIKNVSQIDEKTIQKILKRVKKELKIKANKHNDMTGGSNNHAFAPARFVIAHSELDKASLEHSIEKYNSADNANGEKYLILIGSKIIKESYDLKDIRNVFIMRMPDNIPTLIQIRGRAVRKNSHMNLPPEKRNVEVKIFVCSFSDADKKVVKSKGKTTLTYEEMKYKEKIESFKVIQEIEKILHENAIDAFTNRDIINRHLDTDEGTRDPLSALPFHANSLTNSLTNSNQLTLSQLNLSTFDAYYKDEEVNSIKVLIKRLFIEISSVWTYKDLLDAVKHTRVPEIEFNTHLISEESFIIALHQLTWSQNLNYTEPLILHEKPGDDFSVIDYLYDVNSKIIKLPESQEHVIVKISEGNNKDYYILFPIKLNHKNNIMPNIDIDLPYRLSNEEPDKFINMNNFVQMKHINFDYEDKKKIFYHKYVDITIEHMENVVCEYGSTFHIKFIEECIEYIFRAWTDPTIEKSLMHDFYFKMLYYYDLMSLVLWAYTAKPSLFREYVKYAIPVKAKDIKLKALSKYEKRAEEIEDISPEDNSDLATSGVINLLKSNYNRTSNVWIPKEFRELYEKTYQESLALFVGKYKKNKKSITMVSASHLPIGHFISKFPRVYHPEKGWNEDPLYSQSDTVYKENDIIVGYDERSKTGVHIRFKLREPNQSIKKYKDNRLISRGTVCKSKTKQELTKIAKQLDIAIPENPNVEEMCGLIRSKLIRLELKERIKKSNLKYFYFHFESSK